MSFSFGLVSFTYGILVQNVCCFAIRPVNMCLWIAAQHPVLHCFWQRLGPVPAADQRGRQFAAFRAPSAARRQLRPGAGQQGDPPGDRPPGSGPAPAGAQNRPGPVMIGSRGVHFCYLTGLATHRRSVVTSGQLSVHQRRCLMAPAGLNKLLDLSAPVGSQDDWVPTDRAVGLRGISDRQSRATTSRNAAFGNACKMECCALLCGCFMACGCISMCATVCSYEANSVRGECCTQMWTCIDVLSFSSLPVCLFCINWQMESTIDHRINACNMFIFHFGVIA